MQTRYTTVAIILHWAIALLIAALLTVGYLMSEEELVSRSTQFALYQWHKSLGITVLLLSCARLAWRLSHRPPAMPEHMKPWERFAAHTTHIAFYVLMIGMPLGGWVVVSSSSLDIPTLLYGLVPWPHLPMPSDVSTREIIEDTASEMHEMGATLLLCLIALHVGAALKHQFIDKDNLLARMLPGKRKNP